MHDVRTSVDASDALCESELVGCVSDRANSTHELETESELVCHMVGQVCEMVMRVQEQLVLLTRAVPEALEQRKAVIAEMKGALMREVL